MSGPVPYNQMLDGDELLGAYRPGFMIADPHTGTMRPITNTEMNRLLILSRPKCSETPAGAPLSSDSTVANFGAACGEPAGTLTEGESE